MVEAIRRWFHGRSPYADVVAEIGKLGELDRGWNTYRAGRITDDAQKSAISFIGRLSDLPGPRVPPPSVAPTANGGVALHWYSTNREVGITFLAGGGEYYVAEPGKEDVIMAGSITEIDLLKDVIREHVVR